MRLYFNRFDQIRRTKSGQFVFPLFHPHTIPQDGQFVALRIENCSLYLFPPFLWVFKDALTRSPDLEVGQNFKLKRFLSRNCRNNNQNLKYSIAKFFNFMILCDFIKTVWICQQHPVFQGLLIFFNHLIEKFRFYNFSLKIKKSNMLAWRFSHLKERIF